jgi:hypothetical protein
MIDKMINIHSTVEFNVSERKEIDNIYEERKKLKRNLNSRNRLP